MLSFERSHWTCYDLTVDFCFPTSSTMKSEKTLTNTNSSLLKKKANKESKTLLEVTSRVDCVTAGLLMFFIRSVQFSL